MKFTMTKLSSLVSLYYILLSLVNPQLVSAGIKKDLVFQKKVIHIKQKNITVEIADTDEKAAKGLMYRKKMDENEGMLFVFTSEEPRYFWMKNTFIDLSIAYLNKDKKIIDIQDMKAVKSELEVNLPSYQSLSPAQFALEMRLGWFKKNNIKVGDEVQFNLKN